LSRAAEAAVHFVGGPRGGSSCGKLVLSDRGPAALTLDGHLAEATSARGQLTPCGSVRECGLASSIGLQWSTAATLARWAPEEFKPSCGGSCPLSWAVRGEAFRAESWP